MRQEILAAAVAEENTSVALGAAGSSGSSAG
jgi:hypothetical protein